MIKKALVTLLSSAILATTVVSGVVTTPTVVYAKETNVIKVTKGDCISKDDLEQRGIDLEGVDNCPDILKASDSDTYFLVLSEYREDGLVVYQLDGSVVIETNERRYTVSYDGTSYNVTDVVSLEAEEKENEKAKINKWISDMVVCKHQSAGNVTLSASEKKGTLTVTKADIKTATKLDMMLKSKKAVTIKVKATSKSKAASQFNSLRKLVGHVNTYGVLPWIEADQGIPYTEKISSSKFKKSGSFYTVSISKSISKNYTYLCKAYENAFKRAEKRNTGYTFKTGTHLCDCSPLAKVRMIDELILHNHKHAWVAGTWGSSYKKKLNPADQFKALSGNERYGVYVCEGLAQLAQELGWASGIKSIRGHAPNHTWAKFKVKDSGGKLVWAAINNGAFEFSGESEDDRAISRILGLYHYDGGTTTIYVK